MVNGFFHGAAMAAAMMLVATPSLASDLPAPVSAWFDALRTNDRAAFENLLAENATVELGFIGVTQTRQEYLESLDAWEEANVDGTQILVRPAGEADGLMIFEVCYRFPSNESYMLEGFDLDGEKVVRNTQDEIGDACEGF